MTKIFFNKIEETMKSLKIVDLYYTVAEKLRNTKYSTKQFFKKLYRGYSDPEWYNFPYHNAKYCLPRLKHLKEHMHGHPMYFDEVKTFEDWENILDEIIWGFEFIVKYNDDIYDGEPTKEEWDGLFNAMQLFGKHYWFISD